MSKTSHEPLSAVEDETAVAAETSAAVATSDDSETEAGEDGRGRSARRDGSQRKGKARGPRTQSEGEPVNTAAQFALDIKALKEMSISQLAEAAKELGVTGASSMRKQELIFEILQAQTEKSGLIFAEGVLEMPARRLRLPARPRLQLPAGARRHLRLAVARSAASTCAPATRSRARSARPRRASATSPCSRSRRSTSRIPRPSRDKILFDNLTPLYPARAAQARDDADDMSARVIDLVTPIGKGQRGLIVAAAAHRQDDAAAGDRQRDRRATTPRSILIVLLIDERPEEVTDMQRSVQGEVVSSTFDEPATRHVQVAEMVIEKAKRLVEHEKDVVILLDSITRLARAYNTVVPPSGKILSGGRRRQRAAAAEAVLRRRAQHRGGRLADHHRHRAGRHRQPHGRGHLRGVQGHRQLRDPPRPQADRQARLPGHRHQQVRHPQGRAAHVRGRAAAASGCCARCSTRCRRSSRWSCCSTSCPRPRRTRTSSTPCPNRRGRVGRVLSCSAEHASCRVHFVSVSSTT